MQVDLVRHDCETYRVEKQAEEGQKSAYHVNYVFKDLIKNGLCGLKVAD